MIRLILPALCAAGLSSYAALAGSSAPPNNTRVKPRYLPVAAPKSAAKAARPSAQVLGEGVTFNRDIAPILFENCSSCHRPGQVAPFSLLTYADAKKRASLIAEVTRTRQMPPWKADEGRETFHDARRLSDAQIALIQKWADAKAPEGSGPAPQAPSFTSGWQIKPDVVFAPSEPYALEAEGADVYRCFVVPTDYAEDRYVASVEVQPGANKVVHHVIAYLDKSGQARKQDEAAPGPGYTSFGGPGFTPAGTLGGWAPGNEPRLLPAGMGMLLPKGADIVLQVHYHKGGKPESDLTKIGVTFAKGPVDKRLRVLPLLYLPLRIPAGEANYNAGNEITVPRDVTLQGVMPHMHLLGREMSLKATLPDGTQQKLLNVPDWDFNWQSTYAYQQPIKLPAGTKVEMKARYDNSTKNPANPSNPPREVRWGEETTDEMCIAFLYYTADAEHLAAEKSPGQQAALANEGFGSEAFKSNPGALLRQLRDMFDKDGDGQLGPDERAEMAEFIRKNR